MTQEAAAPSVRYEPLTWKKVSNDLFEAFGTDRTGTHRLRYAVAKEKFGWCLHRYRATRQGELWVAEFKAKEAVRDKLTGMSYADNLWRLAWGQP